MNAPLGLRPTPSLPTTERPAFLEAMAIARLMRGGTTPAAVRAWAAAMKRALSA